MDGNLKRQVRGRIIRRARPKLSDMISHCSIQLDSTGYGHLWICYYVKVYTVETDERSLTWRLSDEATSQKTINSKNPRLATTKSASSAYLWSPRASTEVFPQRRMFTLPIWNQCYHPGTKPTAF